MKVIKIGAIWCGGCLVTNKAWTRLLKDYSFEYEELDFDIDEDVVKKYNPGDKLPLFIIIDKDVEISRFCGEFNYDELKDKLEKEGVIDEKNM